MRPVIDVAASARRRGAGHRARLRADARAARALRDRRTRRSATTAAAGSPPRALGLAHALRARSRAGRAGAASTSRSATAPTTSRSPPSCCGSRRATTFDYEWARVQHSDQLPPRRAASSCRTRSRPSGSRRYGATPAQAAPLPGAQGGVLPGGLRARPGGARRARARRRARRWPSCARRRRSRSTTASSTRCSRSVLRAPARAASRSSCCRARPQQRAELARAGGFVVPERAIDAQSLIAFADLVVSAGGTMNREAVALGTPVWTTFEGRLGAVDERLIAEGRLRRLERADEVACSSAARRRRAPRARAPRPGAASRTCSSKACQAGLARRG